MSNTGLYVSISVKVYLHKILVHISVCNALFVFYSNKNIHVEGSI